MLRVGPTNARWQQCGKQQRVRASVERLGCHEDNAPMTSAVPRPCRTGRVGLEERKRIAATCGLVHRIPWLILQRRGISYEKRNPNKTRQIDDQLGRVLLEIGVSWRAVEAFEITRTGQVLLEKSFLSLLTIIHYWPYVITFNYSYNKRISQV